MTFSCKWNQRHTHIHTQTVTTFFQALTHVLVSRLANPFNIPIITQWLPHYLPATFLPPTARLGRCAPLTASHIMLLLSFSANQLLLGIVFLYFPPCHFTPSTYVRVCECVRKYVVLISSTFARLNALRSLVELRFNGVWSGFIFEVKTILRFWQHTKSMSALDCEWCEKVGEWVRIRLLQFRLKESV